MKLLIVIALTFASAGCRHTSPVTLTRQEIQDPNGPCTIRVQRSFQDGLQEFYFELVNGRRMITFVSGKQRKVGSVDNHSYRDHMQRILQASDGTDGNGAMGQDTASDFINVEIYWKNKMYSIGIVEKLHHKEYMEVTSKLDWLQDKISAQQGDAPEPATHAGPASPAPLAPAR